MEKQKKYISGYPVPDGKCRVSFKEQISRGQYWSTPVDVDSLEGLINKLNAENAYMVTFKYLCYFWEGENFHEGPINTEDITPELFKWVTEKTEGRHCFIEIHKRKSKI